MNLLKNNWRFLRNKIKKIEIDKKFFLYKFSNFNAYFILKVNHELFNINQESNYYFFKQIENRNINFCNDIINDIIIYKYLKKLTNSNINNKQKKLYLMFLK